MTRNSNMTGHQRIALKAVKRAYGDIVGGLLIDQMDNGKTPENTMSAEEVAFMVRLETNNYAPKEANFAGNEYIAGLIMLMIISEKEYEFGEYNSKEIFEKLK